MINIIVTIVAIMNIIPFTPATLRYVINSQSVLLIHTVGPRYSSKYVCSSSIGAR